MTPAELEEIMVTDPWRRSVIEAVAELGLPDVWIAGGFVRNTAWDHIYGLEPARSFTDVDVVYFKPLDTYGEPLETLLAAIVADQDNPVWKEEQAAASRLSQQFPGTEFEVKNQARMHLSSLKAHLGRAPYQSLSDAVADWVETATATGIRKEADGTFSILAPYGLHDLSVGIVRPTSADMSDRAKERATQKGWFQRWPQLRFEDV